MAKDFIDIVGVPQQQSGPIQPDYGDGPEASKADEQQKRLADATERLANASEKQQQINVNVLLDPAKVASQADVPRLSNEQWSEVLGRPVRRGSFPGEGGQFQSARKYYWETQGARKREEFEESVVSDSVRASEDSRERMLEEQHALISRIEEGQKQRDRELERKKAIDDTWQLDDSDRRHRRRVAKFEDMMSGLEAEAGGRLGIDVPGPPAPPVEIAAAGTPQERGPGGRSAIDGMLAGAGLGSLARLGLVGAAGYAGVKAASWMLGPEVGGWFRGAVTEARDETSKGAEQEAISRRMREQAQFAELRGFELAAQDLGAFTRDRWIGQDRANWNRGMFFTGKDREILGSMADNDERRRRMVEQDPSLADRANEEQRRVDALRDSLVKERTQVPQFWSGYREEQERSRRQRGLMDRPVDPETGIRGGPRGNDDEMFLTPDEVGSFGALSILPATLRSAGMNPYLPGEMDKKYQAYHRKPRSAFSEDHMQRDDRSVSPRREDYEAAGLAAPMTYARDTEEDLRNWEKSAENMQDFLKQPDEIRQVFIGNYQYPIQP